MMVCGCLSRVHKLSPGWFKVGVDAVFCIHKMETCVEMILRDNLENFTPTRVLCMSCCLNKGC